jgi:hypothetical protein
MRNDSADRAGREAAVYWGFAAWAHKARGAATDAFGRWSGTDKPATRNNTPARPPRCVARTYSGTDARPAALKVPSPG